MRKFLLFFFFFTQITFAFSLNSKDPYELIAAIFYYSQTKDPKLVDKFCNFLLNSNSTKIRIAAAQALSNYNNNPKALNCLLEGYKKNQNKKLRLAILSSLNLFENQNLYKFYCDIIKKEKNKDIRLKALKKFYKNPYVCLKDLKKLLKLGTRDEKIEVLHIFAINNIRIDQKLLEKLLNNEDEEIKLAALKYCIFVKPSKSILVNIKNIFEDTFNTKIKALSLEILLEKSKNIDEDYLNFALSSEDVRKLISYRLPFLKNKNIPISTMKIFLEDKNDVVKIAALTYLGNSKNKKYCSFLKSYMYKPLKNNVKSAYIWAISKLNCRYAPKYILYIISDMNSENEIRLIASKYLNNLKPSLLEKYKKNIIYIYKKELLDDIKDNLKQVLDKIENNEKN